MEKGGNVEDDRDESKPFARETFSIVGPTHLTFVDWRSCDHRRSVAASLVQAVYVLELDRQQRREGSDALAPFWWVNFHFRLSQVLLDNVDGSFFGAIFEYTNPLNYNPNPTQNPPRYVLAFRGTLIKPESRARDLKLDLQLFLNGLTRNSRYQTALQTLQNLVSFVGPGNVWLAGHSLGAAIALQAGKAMATSGFYVESYLFNPPFNSAPFEKIKEQRIKNTIRIANSVLTAGVSILTKPVSFPHHDDPFLVLTPWIPYMFVHPDDPISAEYIGYFEHRETMEAIGLGRIGRIATKSSKASLISGALGRDGEATHLIPTAYLTRHVCYAESLMKAHGIHQWWKQYSTWNSQLYQLKP